MVMVWREREERNIDALVFGKSQQRQRTSVFRFYNAGEFGKIKQVTHVRRIPGHFPVSIFIDSRSTQRKVSSVLL